MRLEEHAQAGAREPLARRRDRGCDLGRVVAVVVDDRHLASGHREPVHLEPPPGAGEAPDRRGGGVARHAGELERRDRGARVATIVLARDAERPLVRRGVANDVGNAREPPFELVLELGRGRVLRVVVQLEVRDDGDLRRQREDRAVGLVGLHDEVAGAEAGVRTELRHGRADQPRRIAAGLAEGEGDHRRRRPFPVRAADDDRGAQRDELAEELLAPQARHRRVGRRDDRFPARRDDRLRRDLDRDTLERLEVRRAPRSQPPTSAPQARASWA